MAKRPVEDASVGLSRSRPFARDGHRTEHNHGAPTRHLNTKKVTVELNHFLKLRLPISWTKDNFLEVSTFQANYNLITFKKRL